MDGHDLVLVTSDKRLLKAALAEGLVTFNPDAQTQAELEVGLGRRHRFVIVGSVVRSGAVPLGAFADDFVLDPASVGGLDEIEMLQQMGHAGLAVAFMAGTDEDGHDDGDGGS